MTSSPNVSPRTVPGVIGSDRVDDAPAADVCQCGHARNLHDAIATRYCEATGSGELERDCVCHTSTGAYPARL
jgi:hypothetical protein